MLRLLRLRVFRIAILATAIIVIAVQGIVTSAAFDRTIQSIETIFENAAPSVSHLCRAEEELHVAKAALRSLGAEPGAVPPQPDEVRAVAGAVARGWARIDDERRAYESFPPYEGEEPLQAELDRRLSALEGEARATLAADAPEKRRATLERYSRDADSTDEIVTQLIQLNTQAAAVAARRVLATNRRSRRLALFLDALALVVFGVVWSAVERRLVAAWAEADRRLRELDAFAARVAHDLRGPLSVVLVALELVQRRAALAPADRGTIERAERSVAGMNDLIGALLAFARSGARPEATARCEVAGAVATAEPGLRALAEQESASLAFDVAPALAVRASSGVVASVVENLARNAILYLGEAARREVRVRARGEGEDVLIEVSDTGVGIAPEARERIFEPFVRASGRAGGHGLGLATVRRLVEAHGGAIEVRSKVGEGSTFVVRLPRAA